MIGYLLDTSAIWHIFRDKKLIDYWLKPALTGGLHVCEATRTEYLYSAKGPAHRDEMAIALDGLSTLASVPKNGWRWVETAQYKLTQHGQHRSASPIDLLVCATAVHHHLTVLHADNDFPTVAAVLPEVRELDARRIGDLG